VLGVAAVEVVAAEVVVSVDREDLVLAAERNERIETSNVPPPRS
jgi:hypothetical protein